MPLSTTEKIAAIREAAQLGAEYRKELIAQGATPKDALDAMNNFVVMFLTTKGVLSLIDKEDWQDGGV